MIDLNKKYKTKGGDAVEIYKVNAGGNCPVIGAILNLKTNCWDCFRWDINGNSVFDTGSSFNLVEVPNFETVEYVCGYANTVDYFGMRVAVPSGILWLATDEDGTLFGYFAEPYIRSAFGNSSDFWDASTSANVKFAIINFNGDWKQSLMRVTKHD